MAFSEDYKLRSWNVYTRNKIVAYVLKKIDSCGEPAKYGEITFAPSQVSCNRRRSDQWNNKREAHKQHPGSPRHKSTHAMNPKI